MANLPSHRASDSDREQVGERLRHATLEGRLTSAELDERLGLLYASKTYGELDTLVADLPATHSPAPARRRVPRWVGPVGAAMIVIAVIGAFAGGGHQSAAVPTPQGQGRPGPLTGPGPFVDAHHAFIVGMSTVGALLVLVLCAVLVWLATRSNKPSELS